MIKDNLQNNYSSNDAGFTKPVVIAIVALVLVVAGIGYFIIRTEPAPADGMMKSEDIINKEGDVMMKKEGDVMMKKEGDSMMMKYTGTILAGKSAPIIDYNKADYESAISSDKLVILYFYANWCPSCRIEVASAFYPAFNELTTDKVVGIRINYKDSNTDSDEKALAVKYGIPYQHTKVLIKNGKQLLKAPDSWSKDRYLSEINKVITQQ